MGEVIEGKFGEKESPATQAREQLIDVTMRFYGISRRKALKKLKRFDRMTVGKIAEEIRRHER